jgi:hypothetical protein
LLPPAVFSPSFFVSTTKHNRSRKTKMDEYDETEEENNTLFITIYNALLMSAYKEFSTAPVTRNPSILDQQLD